MTRKGLIRLLVVPALILLPGASHRALATTCTTVATSEHTYTGSVVESSYLDTQAADSSYESLWEEPNAGGTYRLTHKWIFTNVPAGALSLTYQGLTCTSDEDFQFGWNPDPNDDYFIVLPGAVIDSCTESSHSVAMGKTIVAGGLGIFVADMQGAPDTNQDSVAMNYVAVVSSPSDTCPSMDYSIGPGTRSGSFADVCVDDGTSESLTESFSSGKSKLKQVWQFTNVPAGNHQLCYHAGRAANTDGDNFQFGFNTNAGQLYQAISNALVDQTDESGCYAFGSASQSGTFYVSVWDTVAGTHLDTVNVNRLVINTDPVCN